MEGTHFIDKEPNRFEALAELQKQQIQSMNGEQLIDTITQFELHWDLRTEDFRNAREIGYRQYMHHSNWDENNNPRVDRIDILSIKRLRDNQRRFLVELKNHVSELKIEKEISDEGTTPIKRINNVLKQLTDGYDNIRRHYISYERVVNPTAKPEASSISDPSTMDEDAIDDCTPYQKCLLYTLDELYNCGYRRYKGQCCEEIKTFDRRGTRAWVPRFDIKQFVYTIAQKDDNFDNWKNFTSRGSVFREVVDNISTCIDPQFPEIVKRRHVWAFKNGVFVGKEWLPDRGVHDCRFYPYESKEFACLDPTIVACKYFDQQFDDFSHIENWQDIPTPFFDSILKYQQFEPEVCHWAYAMGGRLCYDVGELDSWQVIPFFKGIAGSGKSTLLTKVFERFYEKEDVGTLANNIERKFGLSAIKDSFMFVAPEIKADLALEQAEFQSIVSGESVSVAVKNKTAASMVWTVPGVLRVMNPELER